MLFCCPNLNDRIESKKLAGCGQKLVHRGSGYRMPEGPDVLIVFVYLFNEHILSLRLCVKLCAGLRGHDGEYDMVLTLVTFKHGIHQRRGRTENRRGPESGNCTRTGINRWCF